ncbi:hydrogenase expression/formation protein HypE [Desulfonauticus submarinus]|uniref:Hydrogenase expression/formation protein HypE n=1 Tax=Desulfonauticus submarinus TaxID=206665 RepID=A0A1G9ZJV8_9BACT|nr:hydrogenase expression/formation protein HypE [Desulfonauticus submarinus]SDN21584.1 hydrogenase expression/formation protein HypE [Desulfonauticus submarinus]
MSKLLLDYGSGGKASHRLIKDIFVKHLSNPYLDKLDDAAFLDNIKAPLAMSTDSYTVDPIIFPGGDIGSLAVHGTVNDVAMLGAKPRFLSCGFILEEGLEIELLERIVSSMAQAAKHAEVFIVTGDTKVVPKGAVDKIFINTTGIGEVLVNPAPAGNRAKVGDIIIVSGTIGDHGLTILSKQKGISFDTEIKSDSAALNLIIEKLLKEIPEIHVLRDPTRGGLATTLNEIAKQSNVECFIEEDFIPIREEVKGGCSFLGLDPLYLANEGKFIVILPEKYQDKVLDILREDPLTQEARVIGLVKDEHPGKVVLKTGLGGQRLLDMLEGEQLPRIC